jgi:glycosyltransferase involved in cell wall biosynthesis
MDEFGFDIALTTYRRPDMVVAAIGSCLSQGTRLRRVVVVDDASRDTTEERIRALRDPRVLLHVRAENGGIGAARRDAMARSDAEWTVTLDSDHELLPGALDVLAARIERLAPRVGIVGARYRWDTGGITPRFVPDGVLDYEGRIVWSQLPGSIGGDYLCCVSRRVREAVQWSPHRSGLADTLFQLDAARVADAIYLPDCLALQRSDGAEGNTRGNVAHLLARREADAEGGLAVCEAILDRHGDALRECGRSLGGGVLKMGAVYAALLGRRALAVKWAVEALLLAGPREVSPGLIPACAAGKAVFSWAYRRSLIRGGATPG